MKINNNFSISLRNLSESKYWRNIFLKIPTNTMLSMTEYWSLFCPGSIPVSGSALGSPPDRSIYLDNVVCTGREEHLLQCMHNTLGDHNCQRSEEAGVRCGGMSCAQLSC